MCHSNEMRKQMIIALHDIPGIGWHAVNKAIKNRLWTEATWSSQKLLQIGLRRDQAEAVAAQFHDRQWQSESRSLSVLRNAGAHFITFYDEQYPFLLKQIDQPPWILYAKGKLDLLECPAVAIVGTRVPTVYGRHTTEQMARELSESGLTIVSGLARGIDSKAHEAALQASGDTIAVLPTPIDTCYPGENLSLYNRIAERGLLLSETPLGTSLHPGQFHQRNRVIAALSRATIVIEGAKKSGSLITAGHAFEMNREVFAVPGPINSPKSEGPNELIMNNTAKLLSSIQQIFDELPWLRTEIKNCKQRFGGKENAGLLPQNKDILSADEEAIIAI